MGALTELKRDDLRLLYTLLNATRDPERDRLQGIIQTMIAERAGAIEWGALVFEWSLPLSEERVISKGKHAGKHVRDHLAPTLNVYGSMPTWQRRLLYKNLDYRIMGELRQWPSALLRDRPRRRAVRVTRCSSVPVDEEGIDVLGGKVPVDRLVHAGIITGDAKQDIERDARWRPAPPSNGRLVVQVYELTPA